MSFQSPWLLLTLLALPAVVWAYVLFERRRAERAATWASPALVPNLVPAKPGRRRHLPAALFLVALALLLVGFARPQATFTGEREGATVVLAMDVSGSMQANDVKPTRVSAARAAAQAFMKELPSKYRVALVTFAEHATVAVPATHDRGRVLRALLLVPAGQGTALGEGIAQSLKAALGAVGRGKPGTRPPAAILLLSDGANTAGHLAPKDAAARAKKAGIPISTVALGTQNGVVEQKLPGGFTERISVPPDPTALRAIAHATGGRFFAVTTATELRKVYKDLGSRAAKERKPHEITAGATGAAIALMLLGASLSAVWFRRLV